MSGHSKWNNIKRKKEATDGAKAKVFTKIGREIAVCVKEGGGDPNNNSKLRDLIAKAKSNNVPNDNIDRIIKKAMGDGDKTNYESNIYEGYGPSGVAVIVETLTDNKNRTAGDVRHYFDKFGGNLGTTGCVSFMFDKKGFRLGYGKGYYDRFLADFPGTALGIFMGNLLPARIVSALSVALYGMFLAIIVPPAKENRVVLGCVLSAFAASAALAFLPVLRSLSSGNRTIILTVVISALAAILFPRPVEEEAAA